MKLFSLLFVALLLSSCLIKEFNSIEKIIGKEFKIEKLAGDFKFTEGPANDANGNIYFSDIPNNRIHKWSVEENKLSTFLENSNGANGIWIGADGQLLVCLGEGKAIVSIDPATKKIEKLASNYNDKPFNKPNDLWADGKGGIYFTDPNYSKNPLSQDGEHVYYKAKDGKISRVINDFVKPNGIIGTKDGKLLYVTDRGGEKTFVYNIEEDGTLTNKRKICDVGSDGMTLDEYGNLYLTSKTVEIYSPLGVKIGSIQFPEMPANLCFGGKDGKTLFVTARTGFYAVKTLVKGMYCP